MPEFIGALVLGLIGGVVGGVIGSVWYTGFFPYAVYGCLIVWIVLLGGCLCAIFD